MEEYDDVAGSNLLLLQPMLDSCGTDDVTDYDCVYVWNLKTISIEMKVLYLSYFFRILK